MKTRAERATCDKIAMILRRLWDDYDEILIHTEKHVNETRRTKPKVFHVQGVVIGVVVDTPSFSPFSVIV